MALKCKEERIPFWRHIYDFLPECQLLRLEDEPIVPVVNNKASSIPSFCVDVSSKETSSGQTTVMDHSVTGTMLRREDTCSS